MKGRALSENGMAEATDRGVPPREVLVLCKEGLLRREPRNIRAAEADERRGAHGRV